MITKIESSCINWYYWQKLKHEWIRLKWGNNSPFGRYWPKLTIWPRDQNSKILFCRKIVTSVPQNAFGISKIETGQTDGRTDIRRLFMDCKPWTLGWDSLNCPFLSIVIDSNILPTIFACCHSNFFTGKDWLKRDESNRVILVWYRILIFTLFCKLF